MIPRLSSMIAAVCPIDGVSVRTLGDPSTVRIDFQASATPAQIAAAQQVLASFDWSAAAQVAWEAAQQPERTALQTAAANAIAANAAYVALASPTPAQVAAQVKQLSQECTAIIKRLIQLS